MVKGKIKKILMVTAITVVTVVVLVIAFISPIAKYLIEKYDVKYLGREIRMSWLYLNPFTGHIYIHHLKIYEPNSDSTILTADGLSADFAIFKMLKKTYEISSITLTRPVGYVIQDHKTFNFSDLIERFSPKGPKDTSIHTPPVHFNILDMAIKDGEFHYLARSIPVNYYIKNVNIESTGKWWNVDTMIIKFALHSGPGSGEIKGQTSINFNSSRYRLAVTIKKFDLKILEQYLHGLANYGNLSAFLDADIKGEGSMKDQLDLDASGMVIVSDFHFGKVPGEDFASFDKFVLDASEISPRRFDYAIDSFTITHPFFKYERYDDLDNIQKMFGKNGELVKKANADKTKFNLIIEIANYVQKIGENFLQSHYSIGKLALYNGDIAFNDFALREKFAVRADPLNLSADSLDKNNKRITARLTSGIKPYGLLTASVSLDPADYGNFDLDYKLQKVAITMLNPYVITYTSFPLDRGRLDFKGYMNVKDSNIVSENHLVIVDPRVTKREKKKDTKWIPVPLIMSLVRSPGSAIDFSIPIRGNLSNPKFKIWKVIDQVLLNIVVKPPSTGYLVEVKDAEKEVEKSITLQWRMHQAQLAPEQQTFVDRMVLYLRTHPDATITVTPWQYTTKEKEYILLYEAKKKYFMHQRNIAALTEGDSIAVEKMSVKDSQFVHYLDRAIGDTSMNTVQEKCLYILGQTIINTKFEEMEKQRMAVFKDYFGDAATRVKFKKPESIVPFDGFSYYEIDYNGETPKPVLKAYDKLEKLDSHNPRKKYEAKRETTPDQLTGPELKKQEGK